MPRIRTIKPSFFASEDVSALSLRTRLTWIGLWTQCDDQGRAKDNGKLIKAGVWPLDNVSLAEIEEDLDELAAHGRIVRYEVDGRRYLEIANWGEHQSINRPTDSKLPSPDEASYPQVSTHAPLTEDSHQEGKGKEGKGGDACAREREPPTRCPRHADAANPPNCGQCKDARRANEQWHQAQTEQQQADVAATTRCRLCNHEGWRRVPGTGRMIDPPVRCDHQPEQREAS